MDSEAGNTFPLFLVSQSKKNPCRNGTEKEPRKARQLDFLKKRLGALPPSAAQGTCRKRFWLPPRFARVPPKKVAEATSEPLHLAPPHSTVSRVANTRFATLLRLRGHTWALEAPRRAIHVAPFFLSSRAQKPPTGFPCPIAGLCGAGGSESI